MCTAITFQSKQGENFFGRTMDFSYPIEPGLYVVPKHYKWHDLLSNKTYTNRYRFIAIGQETDGMLGFFDGVNERGLAAATLYFDDFAHYDLPAENKTVVASLDFIHYLLGSCRDVAEAKKKAEEVRIAGFHDPITKRAAPLHWIVTDRTGKSIVIEQTKAGLEIYDNPIGVLANSPNFTWHMTNLRNYLHLSTTQKDEATWGDVSLTPFSQGSGTNQLPGGFSSPHRFVRTAFLKTHTLKPETRAETVMACFHIMNSVSIPKGVVMTNRNTIDYTIYTAFMNTDTCEYYVKSYENSQLITAKLSDYPVDTEKPLFLGSIIHPLVF